MRVVKFSIHWLTRALVNWTTFKLCLISQLPPAFLLIAAFSLLYKWVIIVLSPPFMENSFVNPFEHFFHEHRVSKYRYERQAEKFKGVFWGEIQIRISESKNGFCVFWGKSKYGSWINKIQTQGGFFGSNPNPEFWDSQSERFFFGGGGEELKTVFLTSGFQKKKWYATDALHVSEPMLVAPYKFWAISDISFHVCYLFKLSVDCF